MNRFKSRSSAVTVALAACGLAVAAALSGCSAGQVAQTATQQAAVNGTAATVGNITLRNVHLRAAQTSDYVQPGSEVELLFVASNESPDTADKLTSITSDFGTVTLSGDTVPARHGRSGGRRARRPDRRARAGRDRRRGEGHGRHRASPSPTA